MSSGPSSSWRYANLSPSGTILSNASARSSGTSRDAFSLIVRDALVCNTAATQLVDTQLVDTHYACWYTACWYTACWYTLRLLIHITLVDTQLVDTQLVDTHLVYLAATQLVYTHYVYRIAAKYSNKSVFQHWFQERCRTTLWKKVDATACTRSRCFECNLRMENMMSLAKLHVCEVRKAFEYLER